MAKPSRDKVRLVRETTLETKTVFSGRAVNLRVDVVRKRSGKNTTREIVEHADCIVVIPLDSHGNVVLVRQYRTAVASVLLELPAGGIEKGESPEESARRELQEEIGYLPQKIEPLGGFYAAPGYCTEYLHLFLASDLVPSALEAEDTDEIEVVRMPVSEIPSALSKGLFRDAKSIAGLSLALQRGLIESPK